MLDKLMDAGAKVVVFDLVYASETPGDNDFANALLKYKDHMLIGEDFAQISDVEFSLTTPNDRLLLPGSESIVGLVNISGDADGIIRHAKYQTSLEREDGMSGFPDDLTHITVLAVKKFNGKTVIPPDKALHPAAVNGIFSMPDVLRTGPDSRAELEATDGTITRVGANTIFSFEPASRTIHLEQGSLLFHSPHGKGGGTIQTGSATASVIGTTIIVTCTPSGGFKLLDLEGQAEVRYLDGLKQTLEPGQLTFILPGGSVSPVIVFRLDTETKGSALVSGFATPLDSQSK
ncbi:MAG TPA: FecR domain-containing protein, partial [Candidatus Paceibacterota bacterium]|nr:FecR domain-containing protein [Candidatus Paceibacterota bacterium]